MAIVAALVPKVDVVVENFKPGTMAEMGLGYERLREMRKDIILCSISALGQSGPLARLPGYDFIAQAYSGVTSMIGEANGTPYIPLVAVGDVNTGVHGALTRSAFISSAAVRVSSSRAARDRISTISRQPGYSKRPADGS
jgi:crotonobetainyl-CoA:carnitine CoA-transferase CaiB-like acyl-CoA transferase